MRNCNNLNFLMYISFKDVYQASSVQLYNTKFRDVDLEFLKVEIVEREFSKNSLNINLDFFDLTLRLSDVKTVRQRYSYRSSV